MIRRIETPGLSGYGAPVDGAIAHNGEGDPCELISDRDCDKLEWFGFYELRRPHSQPILMGLSMEEAGMGADDQQLSEISVSHF